MGSVKCEEQSKFDSGNESTGLSINRSRKQDARYAGPNDCFDIKRRTLDKQNSMNFH